MTHRWRHRRGTVRHLFGVVQPIVVEIQKQQQDAGQQRRLNEVRSAPGGHRAIQNDASARNFKLFNRI